MSSTLSLLVPLLGIVVSFGSSRGLGFGPPEGGTQDEYGGALALSAGDVLLQARYTVLPADERGHSAVRAVAVQLLPGETVDGRPYQWWQLDVVLADGASLSVRALSERAPMRSAEGCGAFARYLFRRRDGQVIEYRTPDGRALLPKYGFERYLLPTPSWGTPYTRGFALSGEVLGHMAALAAVEPTTAELEWSEAVVLTLDPTLLVGTGRNFKDDGQPPDSAGEYSYVPYEERDYDDMLAAGINYVGVTPKQRGWVEDRAFFFRCVPVFPDDLYRSNYYGVTMFSDEPMVRLGWQGIAPDQMLHPHQIAAMLMTRVAAHYTERAVPSELEESLRQKGVDLGVMSLKQEDVPVWETVYESAFYQLAAGAPGIVHEGRYTFDNYGWHPRLTFGVRADGSPVEMTREEILAYYYAYLRGAARAFNQPWGMAIYGQSDPSFREIAMRLAYDMGAKFIWFWTSDHDHHVPWVEQLRLARVLREHAARHPRRPLEELLRGAETAIVFPMGYGGSWLHVWGERSFAHERLNTSGAFYRDVVGAAMWEAVLAGKRGESYDITVEHPGLEQLGYRKLIRVDETATVRAPVRPAAPRMSVALGEPEAAVLPAPATRVYTARFQQPEIDGAADDWHAPLFYEFPSPPAASHEWSGPSDLHGRFAFGYDWENLYIAVEVVDDVLAQPHDDWSIWRGDSVQIALDPLVTRDTVEYTTNQHEIGLTIVRKERSLVWRWHGRIGQNEGEVGTARVRALRSDAAGRTLYEAAVPFRELAPLHPMLRPHTGISLVLNDNDGNDRKSYLETSPGAITTGKHTALFETLVFEPPAEEQVRNAAAPRAWASLIWHSRTVRRGERAELTITARALEAQTGEVAALLQPLSPLEGDEAAARIDLPLDTEARDQRLAVTIDGEPGRYRLRVFVRNAQGVLMLDESQMIYVY